MTNPYFTETTIDGTPRRPLVEREPKSGPRFGDSVLAFFPARDVQCGNEALGISPFTASLDECFAWTDEETARTKDDVALQWLHRHDENPEIALRLSRLAVIEWLQRAVAGYLGYEEAGFDLRDGAVAARCRDALNVGTSDENLNSIAHRLLDAMGVEP